jgi:tRNA (guanine37-N1)-methyltransferase
LNIKDILKSQLSEEELELIPRSFEIIGSKEKAVAIVEIPRELEEKKELIANAIMKLNKNVKSVLRKASERKGELRLREYELIAGDENTEVYHKEYGCIFKLDPRKVYFSPREASERQRVAKKVKAGENVLVMFSGVLPYGIVIAKVQPKVKKVIGIEINKVAHEYAKENVRINKVSHLVYPLLGDVREECKKFFGEFDRVVMPLPFGSEDFLDIAINCLKKEGGAIHFYSIGEEKNLFGNAMKIIEERVKEQGKKFRILEKKKLHAYKPRAYKVCIDFEVTC